jgi:hypothetical protein
MKTLLIALATLTSLPAMASDTFYCNGIRGDEGKFMYVKNTSDEPIKDGEKGTFLFVVRTGTETIYSQYVNVDLEDVNLSFQSRKNGQNLDAMIYLDGLEETWVKLDDQEMNFDCRNKD